MHLILTSPRAAAALCIACLPLVGAAHHSTAYFSEEVLEIEGVITEVQWRNPHISFTLKTVDEQGAEALWRLVSNSLYNLQRVGITRDLLSIGARVRIAARASELEERVALATNMLLADGTEVVLRRDAEPYWSGKHIGGREEWLAAEGAPVRADEEDRGIFRVWSASELRAAKVHNPYTEAARAAQAAWDPLNNFMMSCEAPGMPYLMTSPHPHEFVDRGETIELRVAWFDQVRTIHMGGSAIPAEQPATRLGHSVGRWEQGTLVVETARVDWPYVDRIGTPQSEAVKIIERFALGEDQSRLDYHMTVIEPLAFTEPATYETAWLALGETVEPYHCAVF